MKIGVVLSGCGVQDGSEIHEAVLTLLMLDRAGAAAVCMAPDRPQASVVNHANGTPTTETRNVLTESARIARGTIQPLSTVRAEALDGLILPGGYGAVRNLCDFARRGAHCQVDQALEQLLRALHQQGKPIGAICIAPAILAKVFGAEHPVLTIGDDRATASPLEAMGATHRNAAVGEIVVDARLKLVTTPAYMLAQRITDAATGIERLVNAVVQLAAPSSRAAAKVARPKPGR